MDENITEVPKIEENNTEVSGQAIQKTMIGGGNEMISRGLNKMLSGNNFNVGEKINKMLH